MAGKQIKQEIVLSGEKQYNAAIKEAQRNLKTLQTALKAETAELGKNATEQQKNEAKVKSLKQQIKEQEKVVQTLREALEQAKEEYGDNADVVAKWEQKLNNARTSLANMKNDLEGVGSGFQTVSTDAAAATVATKSVADALGNIGSAGESVSSAIENIFSGMIDTVTGAVEQLWDLISATAAKANNWTDIAGYWGTDAQTIQQYARAVGASANSFDDLQGAVSKIVMGGKGKTIAELVGISDVNYVNEWDYAMAVMNQLYRMSTSGQNMTPIYEQIFGEKKSTKVMDLINDWGTIQEMLPQFNGNTSGYGMSDEELGTMNDLWVKINAIDEKWQAIKENFAAGFGQVSLDLLVNVEGTLDGIADYLNATDDAGKQAALDKIRTNVEDFFTKLGQIIQECIGILRDVGGDLQGSDDPLTSAIGDILVSLANSLQWMVDNADKVKTAFETIFGIWLLAKLGAVAGKLSSILLQIEAIKTFKGVSAATGAAEAAAAGAAVGGSWATAFWAAAVKAVPALAGLYTLLKPGETADNDWDTMFNEETGTLTSAGWEDYRNNAATSWKDDLELVGEIFGDLGRITGDEGALTAIARYRAGWNGYSLENLIADLESMGYVRRDQEEETEDPLADKPTVYVEGSGELVYKDRRPKHGDEIEEWVDLDAHSDEEKENAVQDWWDAWRNASNGVDTWEEETSAFDWMAEVLGDDFDAVWDRILQRLDETENQNELEDLPYDWWMTTTGGNATETKNENGITGADLRNFNGLPAAIQTAVASGASSGVSGIKVTLDGATVGRLVAPYVSEIIGAQIISARNA